MKVFQHPGELMQSVGCSFPATPWLKITQDRIQQFADATGDHQWIHVDVERAKMGPYGKTIAHGYLTLALVSKFLPEMFEVKGVAMGVNIGVNRVRFPNPVCCDDRIRGQGELISVAEKQGAIEAVIRVTIEVEGVDKPACVADTVSRYYPEH